jgi:hypothetical protein
LQPVYRYNAADENEPFAKVTGNREYEGKASNGESNNLFCPHISKPLVNPFRGGISSGNNQCNDNKA